MQLDHFVVHVENNPDKLKQVAIASAKAGIPFDPSKGKGTSGFRAANIWIGNQYFEIPWLKRPDGGGWRKDWVDLYNKGERGTFCIFLGTNDLSGIKKRLQDRGIDANEDKVSFKIFGLFKKTMPWTTLHLPRLPGTNIEISFIQYEDGVVEKWISKMRPNAKENGFEGVFDCRLTIPNFDQCKEFVRSVFPHADIGDGELNVSLKPGRIGFAKGVVPRVELFAKSENPDHVGKQFSLEDVTVSVVH